jgi:uncharacterized DUF497 family protein
MITWDEKKCQTNRKQHGIDFADCASIFDAPYDPHDQSAVDAFWEDAVLVRGGGPKAVRDALRKNRGGGIL